MQDSPFPRESWAFLRANLGLLDLLVPLVHPGQQDHLGLPVMGSLDQSESLASLDLRATLGLENQDFQEWQESQGLRACQAHPEIRVPVEVRGLRGQSVPPGPQGRLGCQAWVNLEDRVCLGPRG